MSDDFIITPVTIPTVTVELDDPNATISTVEGDGAVFFETSASAPTMPGPKAHQDRAVLTTLHHYDVCGTRTAFYDAGRMKWLTVRRLAARVGALRGLGWNIETVKWCDQHPHPESKQIMYRLVK